MPKSDDEVIADLKEARDNVLELIKSITASPKPTYNIDNQEVDWADYLKMLQASLKFLVQQLQSMDVYCEESLWYPGG